MGNAQAFRSDSKVSRFPHLRAPAGHAFLRRNAFGRDKREKRRLNVVTNGSKHSLLQSVGIVHADDVAVATDAYYNVR